MQPSCLILKPLNLGTAFQVLAAYLHPQYLAVRKQLFVFPHRKRTAGIATSVVRGEMAAPSILKIKMAAPANLNRRVSATSARETGLRVPPLLNS